MRNAVAPTIFAIDTAGERCALALAHGAGVQTLLGEAGHTHLELVMPMIDRLFARGRLRPEQCDAFAFGSGPGSFTGLRVACTIVQGLALGTGRPTIALGNLQLLAVAADAADGGPAAMGRRCRYFVATDARMEQAYWAVYEQENGVWTEAAPPSLCEAGDLPRMISLWQPDCCAGNASWIHRHIGEAAVAVRDAVIEGAILARLARDKFARGEVLAPELALPAYVRERVALTVTERLASAAGGRS
ncbi:putative tRNA threonylcarbamoyladenosine biosynthesis protein TsaB [Burkholderiales bacterium]|nr:putative tRNA threonylcarbamoyladenosine biosynthesis protein TsaB [Burkholderiales bacterium]